MKEAQDSARAAVRIHLFTLLFEDCSRVCVQLVEGSGTIELIVQLIGSCSKEALQGAPGIARVTSVREGGASHEEEVRQGLHLHGNGLTWKQGSGKATSLVTTRPSMVLSGLEKLL